MDLATLSEQIVFRDLLNTFILLSIILALRIGLMRAIARAPMLPVETRRRWAFTLRNALGLIFILGLLFIWGHELNAFAVSLAAIAVALVLATKELILCVSGGVLRVGTAAYSLGDRIEIGGTRGIVMDYTLLATTLLEIGPGHMTSQYTGRAVVLPNSLLLSHPVVNETYMKEYIVQIITVPLRLDEDWERAERLLLEIAQSECAPFVEDAQRQMERLAGRAWLDAPSAKPRVSLQVPEPGRINLLLRIPASAQRPSRIEQAILHRFLHEYKPGVPAGAQT
jgi:small-conductance mechanosensitive channel